MAVEKIVVVDDEPEISELISLYLVKEGYDVTCIENGLEAIHYVHKEKPDLIILDILLPGTDGIEVCRQLRKITNVPIMFISCKSDDLDIILGLGVGGDDYITKPFSPSQLVARVKAQLRRNSIIGQSLEKKNTIKYPGLEIDIVSRQVRVNNRFIALSAKEFDILAQLARTPNRVYRIEHLFQLIWDSDSLGDTRTLMVHVSNLRKKIEPDPANPIYILTVRGVGYKFSGSGTAN